MAQEMKTASKPRTKKAQGKSAKATGAKPRSRRVKSAGKHVTADNRLSMIRELAYLKAESRGFENGTPEQDWIEAEREVDGILMQ
jgi:hypothetical protein